MVASLGVLKFGLDGRVLLDASKPIPIFKGSFGRKRYPFLGIFLTTIGPFFLNFGEMDPCLGIFFVENGTHV